MRLFASKDDKNELFCLKFKDIFSRKFVFFIFFIADGIGAVEVVAERESTTAKVVAIIAGRTAVIVHIVPAAIGVIHHHHDLAVVHRIIAEVHQDTAADRLVRPDAIDPNMWIQSVELNKIPTFTNERAQNTIIVAWMIQNRHGRRRRKHFS